MASTKVPAIYRIPSKVDPELKHYLESVQEALEIRLGRRGDELDRAITLRELISSGLASDLTSIPFNPNNPEVPTFQPVTIYDGTIPPLPTGFSAGGAFRTITLEWDMPPMANFAYTEIWRSTDSFIDNATRVDTTIAFVWSDTVAYASTYYYWINFVSTSDIAGPKAGPKSATTAADISAVMDSLNEVLADLPGYSSLQTAANAVEIIQGSGVPDNNTNRADGTDPKAGDLYLRTSNQQLYIRNTANNAWVECSDDSVVQIIGSTSYTGASLTTAIALAQTDISAQAVTVVNLDATVAAKVDVYRAITAPTGGTYVAGDLWFDTDDYHMYQWNGSAWVSARDTGLATSTALTGVSSTATNAATAASAAASAASAAQGTANTATNTLADIADDDKLTPSEKQQAKTLWDAVATEYAGIVASALATTSTSSSAYTTAYNNLNTYLNTTPDVFDDMDTTTTISRTTWNARWVAYYDAKQALLDAIAAALKVIADAGVANAAAAQLTATNAANAATNAANAASAAQDELDDIAADDKVTPSEKLQAKTLWDAVYAEKPGIVISAGTFSVATTNYVADYDALNAFLNTSPDIFDDMDATTTIVRATWDTRWEDYYDEKQTLLDAIAAATKVLADNAQNTADTKVKTFNQGQTSTGIPVSVTVGDIWIDTDATTTILKGGTIATSTVNTTDNTIEFSSSIYNALSTGNYLTYSNGGGTALGGLTNNIIYYVVKVASTTKIKLAASQANALAASPTTISLTGTGNNAQSLTQSATESNRIYIAQAIGADAIAANEWVARDNSAIQSASSSVTQLSQTTADLAGNASASHVLQVNANGHVAGIALSSATNSSGQVASDIVLLADKIFFTNDSGVTPQAAMVIQNGEVWINAARIKSAAIQHAQIGSLNADTITTGTMSATKLDAGTIETVAITIGASTGARVELDGGNSRIVVIDNSAP